MSARKTQRTAARKRPVSCPVAALATEANELIAADTDLENRANDGEQQPGDDALEQTIADRLSAITEQASYTLARSHVGVAFQLMLASRQADLATGGNEEEAMARTRRCRRLLSRAVDFLQATSPNVGSLYMSRMQYLDHDPRVDVALARADARKLMHGQAH